MADTTHLTIELETILRGLNKTLRGLSQLEKQLRSVASVTQSNRATVATQRLQQQQQRAALTAQRLAQQQQEVSIRAQQLANAQTRVQQTTQRLALAQQKLDAATTSTTAKLGKLTDAHVLFFKANQAALAKTPLADSHVRAFQAIEKATIQANNALKRTPPADAHVRAFRAIERAATDADAHVRAFRANEAALRKAPQMDAHVRAFKAIQKGAEDANHHVLAFRANEAALAKAPQADAHVRAFRAIEAASRTTAQGILSIGNALRSVGQGLASLGATLSVTVTAPLVAAGAASVDAAVRLDSLKRGLAAIVGSADEANRQLARLTQIAKLPGIGFEEAIQGSIRLQAVGFSAQEAEKHLREFANAVALTGGGREELTRVTVQLGQLAAKGKVLSQDLRPIIEAAPAVGRALLQAFGTVNADDIQELGLTTKQFLGVLTDELERLPRAAAGAKNSFENFRDEVFRAAAAVGEALLPGLIRLVEVVGPVVTRLAETFAKLPQPVQLVVIGIAGLLAALGPVLFVVGQLTLGVGRLLVGFVELNTAGILPTIASLRAFASGSLTAATAQRALAASTALTLGVLGGIAAIIGVVAAAFAVYNAFQKDAVTLSKERAEQITTEIKSLEEQVKFLNGLESGVERTADEQQRLSDIYDKLNTQAQIRVAGITDEEKRLAALRAELQRIIELRGQERVQQAASVAAQIADSAAQIAANNRNRESLTERIAANNALVETLEREGRITDDTRRRLVQLGQSTSVDVARAVENLKNESARLVQRQKELGQNTQEVDEKLREYLEALRALDPQQQLTARQLLTLAKNIGLFRGDVEQMVPVLEKYIQTTKEAADATDAFNRSVSENERRLNEAGDRADKAAKGRRTLIQSAAAVARETSVDFEGALKSLREMLDAVPELRRAVERERALQGKSLTEFLHDELESSFKGRSRDKSGTALRNAQEQLAQALAEVAQAGAEQQTTIERLKNDQLLQINENGFRLQLIAYRQYLTERARLTSANLGLEIDAQKIIVSDAIAEQKRLAARATQAGLPAPERARAAAGAAGAEEKAIQAQTKILELQQKQRDARVELNQLLAESAKQQQKDVRQLDVQFAELTGRIEDSLNTATIERFREQLEALGKAQVDISQRLEVARLVRDADEVEELKRASELNQSQIDLIEGIIAQEQAANRLAAAQRLVEQAKERQAQLEQELAFEVENRGLSEEEAIRRRLEGEQRLAASLSLTRDIIRDTIDALNAQGVKPPQALIEFIREVDTEIRGLGELPFSEQFRLIEKEFNRLNDERLRRIQDVERAVRNRDIAEVEGAIIIRRINGEYTDALELQLVLLKRIAEASGQEQLKRQAADAGEIVKDTRDRVADLSKQIDAAGKDAFRSGLTDFFSDILNRTATAKEAVLNFVNSIATAINDVIAENLSKALFESIFGGVDKQAGGIVATVKRLFGFGGEAGAGAAGGIAASATQTAGTTAAVTALTTGATAAATALATGGATAAATLATSVTAAAASFSAAVIAAGAAFAASVGAATGLSSTGALSGSGIGNFAVGDILQPRPGGVIARIAEGGYSEAVLTTDPKYASRQAEILREFLDRTRGLGGRIKSFAAGAFVSPGEAQSMMLSGLSMPSVSNPEIGELAIAGTPSMMKLRQVLVDQRSYRDWLTSSEGEQVIVDLLYRNQPVIRKLGGK
jgi:tape measure domain-containing protein